MKLVLVFLTLAVCVLLAMAVMRQPVTAEVHAAAATAGFVQENAKMPKGIVELGNTAKFEGWGQDAKWGVVKNFDHSTHIKPEYAEKCETCHHTNKNARAEEVPLCVSCHKGPEGTEGNAKAKDDTEITVEIAYHGRDENTANNAGCIVCHKRDVAKKAASKAPTACAGCHTRK